MGRWGAQERGRELFEGVRVRLKVRVLAFRVLVSLGGRSTCVECPFHF
jgi:hypothetical protein